MTQLKNNKPHKKNVLNEKLLTKDQQLYYLYKQGKYKECLKQLRDDFFSIVLQSQCMFKLKQYDEHKIYSMELNDDTQEYVKSNHLYIQYYKNTKKVSFDFSNDFCSFNSSVILLKDFREEYYQ